MIRFVKPEFKDLYLKEKLLSDEDTMSYNHKYGGTIDFSRDKHKAWFERWMNDDKHFYRYIYIDDTFIGEAAYHFVEDKCFLDIIIDYKHRHKGYGKQALKLLIEEAHKNNICELYDRIAKDNPSIKLFLNNGFKIISEDEDTYLIKK